MIYGNQLFNQAAQIPQKAFPELRQPKPQPTIIRPIPVYMHGEMTNKHQQVINPAQQHQKVLNAPVYSG